jgi:aspartyl-tRNA(Asn)/glutamyl-tRNA(Gln) amidotransferase subunit C
MSGHLTAVDVRRIAELARLKLTEAEESLFTRQLTDILEWVAAVNDADTSGVPPTAHVAPLPTAWREDEVVASLPRERVLAGAPDAEPAAGLFRVPKVL